MPFQKGVNPNANTTGSWVHCSHDEFLAWLEKHNIKATELATIMGLAGPSPVSNWISGRYCPSRENQSKLRTLMDTPLSDGNLSPLWHALNSSKSQHEATESSPGLKLNFPGYNA